MFILEILDKIFFYLLIISFFLLRICYARTMNRSASFKVVLLGEGSVGKVQYKKLKIHILFSFD